ncbi:MAG: hypothetical protein WCV86_04875 [Patescibacteria group bacterium]|jgi:hypothetical protein
MKKQQGLAKIYLILLLAVVIIGVGALIYIVMLSNGEESDTSTTGQDNGTGNTNDEASSELGKVIPPAEGDPGIYNGNGEAIMLTEDDLPTAYGPYKKNTFYEVAEATIGDSFFGNIYMYTPQQVMSANAGPDDFTFGMTIAILEDTEKAAKYYNIEVTGASLLFNDPDSLEGSFEDIGNASYYDTDPYVNEYDASFNSTHWIVYVLTSNMTVEFRIVSPTTFLENDLEDLLIQWQNKLSNYQPLSG